MGTHNCPHLGHRITEMLIGRHLESDLLLKAELSPAPDQVSHGFV